MNQRKAILMQIFHPYRAQFLIVLMYAASLGILGIIMDTPTNIIHGLYHIFVESDILITDYIGVGGIGAALVNASLLTIIFAFILYKSKINLNGPSIAGLFLMAGFGLFGKNLVNVWLIIFGVFLYAKFQKDKFSKYIYSAIFGTTLAPISTEIFFATHWSLVTRIILGIIIGIGIGFILPPLSTYLLRVHQGFNLYNIGFTAGIIGTVLVSVLKSYGFEPGTRFIWTSGNNMVLGSYLLVLFFSFIILGFYIKPKPYKRIKKIMKRSGRLITDFVILEGYGPTLINMGLNGLLSTTYVLAVGGDINGPTMGGILTVAGFGAFGKHLRNITPIFFGVLLGAMTKTWDVNEPGILLAALFGTALAPIAGQFGWIYGVLAGFIHSSVTLSVGILHGGLNLYNNGFAAGIVAAVLIPIIEVFRKEDY